MGEQTGGLHADPVCSWAHGAAVLQVRTPWLAALWLDAQPAQGLGDGPDSQRSTEWHFRSPQGSPRGLSGTPLLLSPAVSSAWLLMEMVPETPGQCHFISTLAPPPEHMASLLCLCLPATNPEPHPEVAPARRQRVGGRGGGGGLTLLI